MLLVLFLHTCGYIYIPSLCNFHEQKNIQISSVVNVDIQLLSNHHGWVCLQLSIAHYNNSNSTHCYHLLLFAVSFIRDVHSMAVARLEYRSCWSIKCCHISKVQALIL